jgi:hypothetical protein
MSKRVQIQSLIVVPSDSEPQPWIAPIQPLIGIPSQIQEEIELSTEEFKDLLSSLKDLEAGRYEVLSSELSNEEFLRTVRKWIT